jgi:wobble nucleotide-excising tRNase
MIRTIQSLKAFGVFSDFQWPTGLPEFKQFNLIYGWNYSGKTTLSRAVRCFEQKQPHVDFAGAQVQLKGEDGAIHHLSAPNTAPALRVFNTDFVRENLIFETGNATPILVLGAEDIAKQEMLKEKKAGREKLVLSIVSNNAIGESKNSAIEKALTNYARDFIKNPLSVVSYDKTRFQAKVIECKNSPVSYVLNDEGFAQFLSLYLATEKKPPLTIKVVSLSPVARVKERAAELFARVVTASHTITRLKEDPAVESWVKEGRPLHAGKTTCQFCGQSLPVDFLAHLAGHFSADYENLMAELDAFLGTVQSAQKEEIALDYKGDFYAGLQERFTIEKNRLDQLLEARRSALVTLEIAGVAKQTKAFTSLKCPAIGTPDQEISLRIETINGIIAEHNGRTAEFDKIRQEAFDKLEKHYAASFVRDQKYNEMVQEIDDLKITVSEQTKQLDLLDAEIRALEMELSDASRGAGRINDLLLACFRKGDLRLEVTADKTFQIVRGGVIAKNLSEGEKTAIAFAYFMTRIRDGRHPLADTRVFIDDPVSSLDASHLFSTYALIKTQLSGCKQLFVATHNFEFYSLMRDWAADVERNKDAAKPQTVWKKWAIFYVKRRDDGEAELLEIPKELLRFRSEYHYLFSTLYHFERAGTEKFDSLLSLPNVVRRFMEAFGGIMIPTNEGLHKKMERLFFNALERERVWKFINQYSHNNTITRSLTIPDMSECKAVVEACLKAVRVWDADYFKDLEAGVV